MAQEDRLYCTHCGAPGIPNDLFCRQCGTRRSAGSAHFAGSPGSSPARPSSGPPLSGASGEENAAVIPTPDASLGTVHQENERRWQAPPPPGPGQLSGAPRYSTPGSESDPGRFPTLPTPLSPRTLAHSLPPTPGSVATPPPFLPAVPTCPACARPLVGGLDRCVHCGSPRALVTAGACPHCGAGNPSSNRYCGRCGTLLVANALSSQRPASFSALPVVGSMILPGLGQMMNGEALKGFMLLGAALLMISQGATIFTFPYLLITAIAVIDAAMSRSRRESTSYRHDPA